MYIPYRIVYGTELTVAQVVVVR